MDLHGVVWILGGEALFLGLQKLAMAALGRAFFEVSEKSRNALAY